MRFLRRSLTGIFLLALTLGILAMAGNGIFSALQERWARESSPRPARERVFSANVIRVTPVTVTPVLTSFGELRSRRTLDLRASTGGTVIQLADGFEEGGTVEKGQLLLRIDPIEFESALEVARTDLLEAGAGELEAQAALILAQDDLASAQKQAELRTMALVRQRDLVNRGVGTEAAVEIAALAAATSEQAVLSRRQSLASAQARVTQAKNTLLRRQIAVKEAERRLAETQINAEFSGTLSEVSVVQGGIVTPNERIAQIVDPEALEVSFRVSTAQYIRLLDDDGKLMNADVTVRLDVSGVDLVARGAIARESAAVGDGQTGRLLFARLDQPKGFRPGDFVTVEIREPALERVVVLPATALDASGTLLVLGENDRLEQVAVELLRRQGDDVLVRATGLAGREVVAERSPLLGAGIRVRAVRISGGGDAPVVAGEPEMIALSPERRAALIAFVESNQRMPQQAKDRLLNALRQDMVPAETIARLESRMGG